MLFSSSGTGKGMAHEMFQLLSGLPKVIRKYTTNAEDFFHHIQIESQSGLASIYMKAETAWERLFSKTHSQANLLCVLG